MQAKVKPQILVVDDEPQVVRAIEDQLEDAFVVHASTSGPAALALLGELRDVSVLLSDQRLPGMTGDELFARAAEFSDATRVMITGYADLEAVIRAVNRGNLFGYVTKPWDEAELQMTLHKADEHYRLVRELHHERDLLRNLMDNVPAEIYFKGRDHRYIRINWPAARGQGIPSPEAAVGRLDSDFIHDEVRGRRVREEDRHIFETGSSIEVDELRTRPDGTDVWMSKTKAPVRDNAGNVTSIVAIARDITSRKALEQDLAARENQLRNVLDTLPVGVWVLDRNGQIIMNNPASKKIWAGMRPGGIEVFGEYKGWWAKNGERIAADEWAGARAVQRGETSLKEMVEIECFDGTRKTIFDSAVPIIDAAGKVQGAVTVNEDITNLMQLQHALMESNERFQALLQAAPDAIFLADGEGRLVLGNAEMERVFGYSREELEGKSVDLLVPASRRSVHSGYRSTYLEAPRARQMAAKVSLQGERKDGSLIPVEIALSPVMLKNETHVIGIVRDVTERREQEKRIARLTRMHAMLSGINSTIVRVSSADELFSETCRLAVETGGFKLVYMWLLDEAGTALLPVASFGPSQLEIASLPLEGEGAADVRETTAVRAFAQARIQYSNDLASDTFRTALRERASQQGIASVASLPLKSGKRAIGVATFASGEAGVFDEEEIRLLEELAGDISFALDHLEKAKQVDYLSFYDPLTGLANRTLFEQRLQQQLTAAAAEQRRLALVLMDVERFRLVNDSLGRAGGDALLKAIAQRMVEHGKDATRLARVGADYFAIFVSHLESDEELGRLTQTRFEQLFGVPYRIADGDLRVAARFGIAMYPNDASDVDTLFRNAEAALKKAKERGERYMFFEQRMAERVAEQLTLESRLRQAIEKQQFILYYQTKVDVESRAVVGLEALIRWQSPELGLVSPGKFIPLLEETGLIVPVGRWALNRAATEHRRWYDLGLKPPRVAVNVSSVQLRQRDFVRVVEEAILDGIAPTAIDLEITESMVMQEIEENIAKLKAVRALGLQIAIDDFGTGYSSLAYLAKLPVTALKIDRAFIIKMLEEPQTMTLVSTMISLAHSLRLKVVAEGVDEEEQAKILRLLRCDELQGYLVSRPVPAHDIEAMLRNMAAASLPRVSA